MENVLGPLGLCLFCVLSSAVVGFIIGGIWQGGEVRYRITLACGVILSVIVFAFGVGVWGGYPRVNHAHVNQIISITGTASERTELVLALLEKQEREAREYNPPVPWPWCVVMTFTGLAGVIVCAAALGISYKAFS